MTISSRTPEGSPHQCPICGQLAFLEPSYPGGDSCCPGCGSLLWWFRDRFEQNAGIPQERVTFSSSLTQHIGANSLDIVELMMQLEEAFGITIPAAVAERLKTIEDVIRYIQQHRPENAA